MHPIIQHIIRYILYALMVFPCGSPDHVLATNNVITHVSCKRNCSRPKQLHHLKVASNCVIIPLERALNVNILSL